jgi:membrane protein required for colicin V production
MTALDIVCLVLLGAGAALGAMRGFVQEALSLIAWVLAVIAVKFLHSPATDALAPMVGTTGGAAVLAFALLFGGTFILGKLLARSLGARTRSSVLGPFDRVLGLGFGFLKGLLGATLLFLAVTLVVDTISGGPRNRPDWLRDSRTYPLLNATSRAMVDYLNQRRAGAGPPPSEGAGQP